jgi:hypothetical protein
MIEYGKPIRTFHQNLLRHGVQLSVEDGRLRVRGNLENVSPAYRDEIVKRAPLLIEVLTDITADSPPTNRTGSILSVRSAISGRCSTNQAFLGRYRPFQ